MIDGVADAVVVLLVGELRLERSAASRRDRHADEVDEVAGDDDAPAVGRRLLRAVVREQAHEIAIDGSGPPRLVARRVLQSWMSLPRWTSENTSRLSEGDEGTRH